MDEQARFWSKVDRSGGCWLWTAATTRGGYGLFSVKRDGRWVTKTAHRLSWEYAHGEEPAGMVLHNCDRPGCVNPACLVLGDARLNAEHAMSRDRLGRIPAETVERIRSLRAAGHRVRDVARVCGVSMGHVSHLCQGKSRKTAPGETHKRWAKRTSKFAPELTE